MVHDKDLLVREMGARHLQAQEGVQVYVVPIGKVTLVEQAVQVGAQVLARILVFCLQFPDLGINMLFVPHADPLVHDDCKLVFKAVEPIQVCLNGPHRKVGFYTDRDLVFVVEHPQR